MPLALAVRKGFASDSPGINAARPFWRVSRGGCDSFGFLAGGCEARGSVPSGRFREATAATMVRRACRRGAVGGGGSRSRGRDSGSLVVADGAQGGEKICEVDFSSMHGPGGSETMRAR